MRLESSQSRYNAPLTQNPNKLRLGNTVFNVCIPPLNEKNPHGQQLSLKELFNSTARCVTQVIFLDLFMETWSCYIVHTGLEFTEQPRWTLNLFLLQR